MKIVSKRHAAAQPSDNPWDVLYKLCREHGIVLELDGTGGFPKAIRVTSTVTASPTITASNIVGNRSDAAKIPWAPITADEISAYIRGDYLKALDDARTPGVSE